MTANAVDRPVVVNALSLRPAGAGISTYIRELLAALPPLWQQQVHAHVQDDAVGDLPGSVSSTGWPVSSGTRRAVRAALLPHGAGVFHSLDVDLPLRAGRGSVITVHDLSVFDVPWAFDRFRSSAERLLVRHAMTRADVVLADSHFTARRIRKRFGRDSVVAHLAASSDMQPADDRTKEEVVERYGLHEDFVLFVGTVEPRKDVPLLAQACYELSLPLVLAGGAFGPQPDLPGRVRRLGFVPAADLPALYGAARVVAYPSLYEGFGLPPVEALACGAALVCSRVADLQDLLHDGAVFFDARDPDGIRRALKDVWHDEGQRKELRERGLAAVGSLSWARTAAITTDVYEGFR